MKKLFILLCISLLSACNQYTLVKPEKNDINGLSVTPVGNWNLVPTAYSADAIPTWTTDGSILNSIMFFSKIANGQKLITGEEQDKFPSFDSSMLPNEVMELVESTFSKLYSANVLERGALKPYQTQSGTGFQFSFKFAGQDNLPRQLLATGILKDDHLYIVVYQAASLYYYEKDLANVRRMMSSISIS